MKNIFRDFISRDSVKSRFTLGGFTASSLSGFITGVVAASIVWYVGIFIMKMFFLL